MTKKNVVKKPSEMTVWEQKFSGYAKTANTTEWEAVIAYEGPVYVLATDLESATKLIRKHSSSKIVSLKDTGKKVWTE